MSLGNAPVVVRLNDAERAALMQALERRNRYTVGTIWTVSDWVRNAIREKLDHGARSRAPRKRKVESAAQVSAETMSPAAK